MSVRHHVETSTPEPGDDPEELLAMLTETLSRVYTLERALMMVDDHLSGKAIHDVAHLKKIVAGVLEMNWPICEELRVETEKV